MDFTAIDFETANNERSSICSIGLAIVKAGKIIETKHILVKPTPNYFEPYNTLIHGIDERQTRSKKTFKQQWKELKPYFNNNIIVAHNASFDCSVLRFALDRSNLTYPDLEYYCTYRLSQKSLNIPRHGLDRVSRHFKIRLKHHNAESDAQACALIALKLLENHNVNSIQDLSKGLGFRSGKIISETRTYRPFSSKR